MSREHRKALIAAYKERKTVAGVYAVICSATGEGWVGQSRSLDAQRNGLWFVLKHGSCRNPELQAAWNAHGEAAFRFEALDPLPETVSDLMRPTELKKRAALWMARLQAAAI